MKTTSTVLACALLALAGCASDSSKTVSSDGAGGTSMSGTMGSSGTAGSSGSSGSSGSTASTGTTGTGTAAPGMATAQAASMGVVQTIDQITRQDAMSMGLASGAAAAGGAMGSPTGKVYRVTLRMDDGTTQTVIAESMPSYRNGDRVRYANGAVQRE